MDADGCCHQVGTRIRGPFQDTAHQALFRDFIFYAIVLDQLQSLEVQSAIFSALSSTAYSAMVIYGIATVLKTLGLSVFVENEKG